MPYGCHKCYLSYLEGVDVTWPGIVAFSSMKIGVLPMKRELGIDCFAQWHAEKSLFVARKPLELNFTQNFSNTQKKILFIPKCF